MSVIHIQFITVINVKTFRWNFQVACDLHKSTKCPFQAFVSGSDRKVVKSDFYCALRRFDQSQFSWKIFYTWFSEQILTSKKSQVVWWNLKQSYYVLKSVRILFTPSISTWEVIFRVIFMRKYYTMYRLKITSIRKIYFHFNECKIIKIQKSF